MKADRAEIFPIDPADHAVLAELLGLRFKRLQEHAARARAA